MEWLRSQPKSQRILLYVSTAIILLAISYALLVLQAARISNTLSPKKAVVTRLISPTVSPSIYLKKQIPTTNSSGSSINMGMEGILCTTYVNDVVGISFKCPPNTYIATSNTDTQTSTVHTISVDSYSVDDINKVQSPFMPSNATEEAQIIARGEFDTSNDFSHKPSEKNIPIANTRAKEYMVFGRFHTGDVNPQKILVFYANGYRIQIKYSGSRLLFFQLYPQAFENASENCTTDFEYGCYIWKTKGADSLYNDMKNGSGPSGIQQWYNGFDTIVNTLQIYPPKL